MVEEAYHAKGNYSQETCIAFIGEFQACPVTCRIAQCLIKSEALVELMGHGQNHELLPHLKDHRAAILAIQAR